MVASFLLLGMPFDFSVRTCCWVGMKSYGTAAQFPLFEVDCKWFSRNSGCGSLQQNSDPLTSSSHRVMWTQPVQTQPRETTIYETPYPELSTITCATRVTQSRVLKHDRRSRRPTKPYPCAEPPSFYGRCRSIDSVTRAVRFAAWPVDKSTVMQPLWRPLVRLLMH